MRIDNYSPRWVRLTVASLIIYCLGFASGFVFNADDLITGLGWMTLIIMALFVTPYALILPWKLYDLWVRLLKVPWLFRSYIIHRKRFLQWFNQEWKKSLDRAAEEGKRRQHGSTDT